jgi:acetylornithine deacetylase/succinyl-diaminopimelate desuccinylase-like protein
MPTRIVRAESFVCRAPIQVPVVNAFGSCCLKDLARGLTRITRTPEARCPKDAITVEDGLFVQADFMQPGAPEANMPTPPIEQILKHIDADLDRSCENLFALLRIPSISAQPAQVDDCRRAAEWVRDRFAALGFAASLRSTPGHPVVLAHHPGPAGYRGPHILFYAHYDVQPPDPLDLWTSPPFEPQLVDGPRGKRIVARGAVDDKGQMMMFLEALRAWNESGGGIPARITALIEGEEEVGSVNLDPFLEANAAELGADLALISDTNMWDVNTPAITTRLRGLVYTEISLRGPNRDLHSGLFGGAALNPINALTRILGELHDADGRVQIPGFYDRVKEVPPEQARQWAELGFDETAFLGEIGLSAPSGERDRGALERLWARPTADINGIWGGYTGPGSKTVIAAEARAKLSFRLVPDQDPDAVIAGLRRFLNERTLPDARIQVQVFGASPGMEIDTSSPWVQAARGALAEEYGRPAVLIGSGGSIPVVQSMRRVLGIDSLLLGFGLDDDQIHSPNEKFELACFHHGIRSHARLLAKFAAA